jgi:hypothetical protein
MLELQVEDPDGKPYQQNATRRRAYRQQLVNHHPNACRPAPRRNGNQRRRGQDTKANENGRDRSRQDCKYNTNSDEHQAYPDDEQRADQEAGRKIIIDRTRRVRRRLRENAEEEGSHRPATYNVMPLSGRGGTRATLDRKQSISPPRSAPAAGYPAASPVKTVFSSTKQSGLPNGSTA